MTMEKPGVNAQWKATDEQKYTRRSDLEHEVQNLYGPIMGISEMTDAELYGLRDEFRGMQRKVGKDMEPRE